MKSRYRTVSIYLHCGVLRALRKHLSRRAMTRSEYVRNLIRRDIRRAHRERLAKATRPPDTLPGAVWTTEPPNPRHRAGLPCLLLGQNPDQVSSLKSQVSSLKSQVP